MKNNESRTTSSTSATRLATANHNTEKSYVQIVNVPESVSSRHKAGEWSFTFIMWLVLAYLLTPILNVFAWYFFGKTIYSNVFMDNQYDSILLSFKFGFYIILLFFCIIWSFVFYNKIRFHKKNRRKYFPLVTNEDLAHFFNISEHEIQLLKFENNIFWNEIYISESQLSHSCFTNYSTIKAVEKQHVAAEAV